MHVLVVEDDADIADAVCRGLTAEGFTTDVATSGPQGELLAKERKYAAILLDVLLPGRNGYLVCRNLREADITTPILMLTAKAGEYDEAEGLDTGADDYLAKPFSFVVLLARLRALIRRAGADVTSSVYVCGDLLLDPASHKCRRGDIDIELTAKEFAVLRYLLMRQGQVVTKQQILDAVWEPDFEGDANIIEVYIRHLRAKIDEPFGRRSITTIRNAGYRLDPS